MSWNNGYETKKLNDEVEKTTKELRKVGMNEENIVKWVEFLKEDFKTRRNNQEFGKSISLNIINDESNNVLINEDALKYEDTLLDNPFEYGFESPRLEMIWKSLTNDIDKKVFILLYNGKNQRQIGEILCVSQQAIAKKIKSFRKNI